MSKYHCCWWPLHSSSKLSIPPTTFIHFCYQPITNRQETRLGIIFTSFVKSKSSVFVCVRVCVRSHRQPLSPLVTHQCFTVFNQKTKKSILSTFCCVYTFFGHCRFPLRGKVIAHCTRLLSPPHNCQPNPKQSKEAQEETEDSTTITFGSSKRSSKCDLSTVCHSVINTQLISSE